MLNLRNNTAIGLTSTEWQNYLCELAYAHYDLNATSLLIISKDGGSRAQNSFDFFGMNRVETIIVTITSSRR